MQSRTDPELLSIFLDESAEHLQLLESETMHLERDPAPERIQIMFRAAHTIKGAARALEFHAIAELTHSMEERLDGLRSGQMTVDKALADGLLADVDRLAELLRRVVESGTDYAAPYGPIQRIRCRIDPTCTMKGVRAFMAMQAMHDLGVVTSVSPSEVEQELDSFDGIFEVVLETEHPANIIHQALIAVGDIASVEIEQGDPSPPILDRESSQPGEAVGAVKKPRETGQSVRVDVGRLDALMDMVGELVIDRARLAQVGSSLAATRTYDSLIEGLAETTGHIARLTTMMQAELLQIRMLPMDLLFNRVPRVVRDLADQLGKQVELTIEGGDTELDRTLIEALGDPLLHILRNCVDHGLENEEIRRTAGKPPEGRITLSACHKDNQIVIEIVDDGKGLDADLLKERAIAKGLVSPDTAARMTDKDAWGLIFAGGVTTASGVTSISGRGVGMDIVRTNMEKLGGMIDVDSEIGQGTRFVLRLPLTLAIIRSLLVEVSQSTIAIPIGNVVEALALPRSAIRRVGVASILDLRGRSVPIVWGSDLFGFTPEDVGSDLFIVIAGHADRRLGLVVDRLIGDQEVVIKPLSRILGDVACTSGLTILGDGRIALIMDVASAAREAMGNQEW